MFVADFILSLRCAIMDCDVCLNACWCESLLSSPASYKEEEGGVGIKI